MTTAKVVQFYLWEDCNNECSFCFLKKGRLREDIDKKILSISMVIDRIKDELFISNYSGIGLIGGEIFQGQLSGLMDRWMELIDIINKTETIKTVWLAATLTVENQDDLFSTISAIHNKKILICTSYDTLGRFNDKSKSIWRSNVLKLKASFPHIPIHSTTIITQDLVDKFNSGEDVIPDCVDNSVSYTHLRRRRWSSSCQCARSV